MNNPLPKNTIDILTGQINALVKLMSAISFQESLSSRYYLMTGGFFSASTDSKENHKRQLLFISTIRDLLNEYGIHESNKGYIYIIDAVRVILELGSLDIRLNTDIYPLVACDFKIKKISVIEHAIRNAIAAAYRDYERSNDSNAMGRFTKKPSNKKFLFHITDSIFYKINVSESIIEVKY
ncbi:MAG: hypothetical protein GX083_02390 [Clostridiales bacterium]|nr:hypothetical protein [Clostridiales bacterium]